MKTRTNLMMQLRYIYMICFILAGLWIVHLINENAQIEEQVLAENREIKAYLIDQTFIQDDELIYVKDPRFHVEIEGSTVTYSYEANVESKVRMFMNRNTGTATIEVIAEPKD